jgi:hypothetical protein
MDDFENLLILETFIKKIPNKLFKILVLGIFIF